MKYPWSDMPKPLLRALAGADPRRAVEMGQYICGKRNIPLNLDWEGEDRTFPVFLTMSGVSRWMSSKRRIIDLSRSSMDLLAAWEPRFAALPFVEDKPWTQGLLFRFAAKDEVLMYMEPMVGDQPGVSYVIWMRLPEGGWSTVVPKDMHYQDVMMSGLDTFSHFSHMLGAKRDLAIAEDGTRLDLGELRKVGINALAAINEDPSIIVMGRRKAPRKNRDRAGGISKVRRLTLSYDGARLVTRRWVILPTEEQTEKIEHSPHKSPGLHTVQPHFWRVWVNNPKEGEKVLETREKEGKGGKRYLQYRVKRVRGKNGAYSRGKGEVVAKQVRLVTGPEDLSPHTGA
tara:strand:+ start:77 stop:1105 length:1029 start_codon:yes stop_codon:yes gene_type:complete